MRSWLSIPWLDQLTATIQSLPAGVHAPAIIAFFTGLVLWLVGAKVLKPATAVLGTVTGALLGAFIFPQFMPDHVGGIESPYIGLGAGAVIGLALAAAMFRFAMSVAAGLVFLTLGTLGTGVYLSYQPGALNLAPMTEVDNPPKPESVPEEKPNTDSLKSTIEAARKASQEAKRVVITGEKANTRVVGTVAAEQTKAFLQEVTADGRAYWDRLPPDSRLLLGGIGLGAGIVGLLIGSLMPRKAAALVTSLLGAAAWLASGVWLARALELNDRGLLDHGPTGWLIIWAIAAVIGLVFQLARPKPQPKPEAETE